MYPTLREGVELGTYECEGLDFTFYYAKNAEGKKFKLPYSIWAALLKADGTAPLDLPNEGKDLLPKLKKHGLVRTSRFVRDEGQFDRFILFVFKRNAQRSKSKIFKVLDALLPFAAFLSLAIGVARVFLRGTVTNGYLNLGLFIVLLLLSVVLHEVAHAIVGLAHGYKIHEAGILFFKFIPCGAYVAHEDRKDEPRWGRFRFLLAGIEADLLLSGIFYILAAERGVLSLTMRGIADLNVLLAIVNLFPAPSLDGEGALSALCGVDSIQKIARKALFSAKTRKKLLHSGLLGICVFLFLGAVLLARVFSFLFSVLFIVLQTST